MSQFRNLVILTQYEIFIFIFASLLLILLIRSKLSDTHVRGGGQSSIFIAVSLLLSFLLCLGTQAFSIQGHSLCLLLLYPIYIFFIKLTN